MLRSRFGRRRRAVKLAARRLWAGFVFAGLAAGPVFAQPGAAAPADRLPDLLAEALERNPEVEAARLRWEAVRERIPQARSLEDPKFGYTVMGSDVETRVGPQEMKLMVSQHVPLFGKLGARERAAAAAAEAEAARYRAVLLDVERDVTAAYHRLVWLQEAQRTVREQMGLLDQVLASARARYASLQGDYDEVVKVHLEMTALEDRLEELVQKEQEQEALLNRLLDRPSETAWPRLGREAVLPPSPRSLESLFEQAEAVEPDLRAALALEEKAAAEAELARRGLLPDVTVGVEYIGVVGGTSTHPDDGKDAWMVPLTFNLPVWERPRARVREMEAALAAARREAEAVGNRVRARIRAAHARWVAAHQRWRLSRSTTLPEAESAMEAALAAYGAGGGSLMKVLDSHRRLLMLELEQERLFSDLQTAQAELKRAVGTSPAQNERPVRRTGGDEV